MWFLKEFWYHRKLHGINMLSMTVAFFLVATVSILSEALTLSVEEEFSSLGLDVSSIQVLDNDRIQEGWFDRWKKEHGIREASVFFASVLSDHEIVSCDAALGRLFPWDYLYGRFFETADDYLNDNVAVLGYQCYQDMGCPGKGETVTIEDVSFKVVGVIEKQNSSLFIDTDHCIFIPAGYRLTTAPRQISYYFKGNENGLDEYFGKDDYLFFEQGQMVQATGQVMKTVRGVVMFLAAVSVAVAYISMIGNTVSSLPQRSYEIGIKKAFGAGPRLIYRQFILETMTVLTLSSFISLILCWLLITIISRIVLIRVSFASALAVMVRLMITGVICGLYPALKASKITVMDAIRDGE